MSWYVPQVGNHWSKSIHPQPLTTVLMVSLTHFIRPWQSQQLHVKSEQHCQWSAPNTHVPSAPACIGATR